jgi:hypothetical protein
MKIKIYTINFIAAWLLFTGPGQDVNAQDPGDRCEPDLSTGHTARIVSMNGTVHLFDHSGNPLQSGDGSVVPSGSKIVTDAGARAELALEDGTAGRLSRVWIGPGSEAIVTGGLYCSDLRPKWDEGRWSAREAGIELILGGVEIELAEEVSYSYNIEVKTPNAVARMVRGTEDKMIAKFRVAGLDDRQLVSVIDHPQIRSHLSGLLMGRSVDDLSPREKEGVMTQATMAALSLGLVDLGKEGLLENPQFRATLEMMTRGRKLSDLEENERNMIMQGVAAMALQQGLLNPETLKVYDRPDEHTRIEVHAGKMRVHNKHRGWNRNEAVDVETGMVSDVKGYDIPERPALVQ